MKIRIIQATLIAGLAISVQSSAQEWKDHGKLMKGRILRSGLSSAKG